MTKTLLVEEPNYWDIKDAQTILEKKGIKMTLPELMSNIIPKNRWYSKHYRNRKNKIYETSEQTDECSEPNVISFEEAIKTLENKENKISQISIVYKGMIQKLNSWSTDIYYKITLDTNNYDNGGVEYIYIPKEIINNFRKYIENHKIVSELYTYNDYIKDTINDKCPQMMKRYIETKIKNLKWQQ